MMSHFFRQAHGFTANFRILPLANCFVKLPWKSAAQNSTRSFFFVACLIGRVNKGRWLLKKGCSRIKKVQATKNRRRRQKKVAQQMCFANFSPFHKFSCCFANFMVKLDATDSLITIDSLFLLKKV